MCVCVYVHEYAVATRSHSSDGPPTKQGRIVCAHCTQRADMAERGEGRGGEGRARTQSLQVSARQQSHERLSMKFLSPL